MSRRWLLQKQQLKLPRARDYYNPQNWNLIKNTRIWTNQWFHELVYQLKGLKKLSTERSFSTHADTRWYKFADANVGCENPFPGLGELWLTYYIGKDNADFFDQTLQALITHRKCWHLHRSNTISNHSGTADCVCLCIVHMLHMDVKLYVDVWCITYLFALLWFRNRFSGMRIWCTHDPWSCSHIYAHI